MVGEPRAESEERLDHFKLECAILALGGKKEAWDELSKMGFNPKSEEDLFSMLEEDHEFGKIVEICVRHLGSAMHVFSTEDANFLSHWGVLTYQLIEKIGGLAKKRQKPKLGSLPI